MALPGVAFALLLLFGWFLSGGDAPNYTAPDNDWIAWADDNSLRSGIGGFLILLVGTALLHFAGTIRSALEGADTTIRGSVELARVAFAGAIVGAAGIATAIVMVAAAASEGAAADPVLPGILALVIWSIATSIATYRARATTSRDHGHEAGRRLRSPTAHGSHRSGRGCRAGTRGRAERRTLRQVTSRRRTISHPGSGDDLTLSQRSAPPRWVAVELSVASIRAPLRTCPRRRA